MVIEQNTKRFDRVSEKLDSLAMLNIINNFNICKVNDTQVKMFNFLKMLKYN